MRAGSGGRGSGSAGIAGAVFLVMSLGGACGTLGGAADPGATTSVAGDPSASPSAPGSPTYSAGGSPTLDVSASPSGTDPSGTDPSGTGTPAGADPPGSPSTGTSGSPTPLGPAPPSPASCSTGTPVRAQRVVPQPPRTTEVVTVVSDGRTLTSGTREQGDFAAPSFAGPSGTAVTDSASLESVARLVAAAGKTRVLLARPEPPDADLQPARKPFDAAGTYVLFNASAPLTAEVVVQCSGQEQVWTFSGESEPTTGQVNCAVEPGRGATLARAVYQTSC